jgi:putative Holliday junction resolvase
MTYLGVDYGRKRTGIAVCLEGIVLPCEPVLGSWNDITMQIEVLKRKYDGVEIVLGLPLSSSGKSTELSMEVEQFAEWLSESGYIVKLVSEVRSSAEAARLTGKTDRKGHLDSLAACEILKRYLNLI